MESIQKYYKNTMDALPHPIVEEFVKMNITPQNAIDLGGWSRERHNIFNKKWLECASNR